MICYATAKRLGTITMLNAVRKAVEDGHHEELARKFPALFNGKLGCFKDVQVRLDIDEKIVIGFPLRR